MKADLFATGAFQKYPDTPLSRCVNQGPRGFWQERCLISAREHFGVFDQRWTTVQNNSSLLSIRLAGRRMCRHSLQSAPYNRGTAWCEVSVDVKKPCNQVRAPFLTLSAKTASWIWQTAKNRPCLPPCKSTLGGNSEEKLSKRSGTKKVKNGSKVVWWTLGSNSISISILSRLKIKKHFNDCQIISAL